MKSIVKFLTWEEAVAYLALMAILPFGNLIIQKELDGYFHVYDMEVGAS